MAPYMPNVLNKYPAAGPGANLSKGNRSGFNERLTPAVRTPCPWPAVGRLGRLKLYTPPSIGASWKPP